MLIGLIAFGLVLLGLTGWIFWLDRRITRLFQGRGGENFEELAISFGQELTALNQSRQEIERFLGAADQRLQKAVSQIRTLRYNPFPDQGGNQSFSTAWLDERGDGVIITGLHARDTMRVYAKPVRARGSEFELTTEEAACLAIPPDTNPPPK
ncbi:MAG: DUF4446 family protein [Patescibacteria group bacterium]